MGPDAEMLMPEGGCRCVQGQTVRITTPPGSTRHLPRASCSALLISDDLFLVHILIVEFQRHNQALPRLQRVPGCPCRSLRALECKHWSI